MADDKTRRGSPDNKRLNKGEPYEVAYAKSKAKKAAAGKPRAAAGKPRAAAGKPRAAAAPAPRKKPAPKPAVRVAPHPPTAEKTTENTAPRTMKTADAVDLLTDDHLHVSALFKQYEKLSKRKAPADQRRALADTICNMLTTHTTIEEEIFYPAARKARIGAALLDEADIEHASAKALIAQIENGNPDADHYDAKVKVLGDYVTHHVVEEHTEMFPKCRRAGMDLVALRGRMQTRKAELESDSANRVEQGVPMAASTESAGILARISDSLFSGRKP